MGNGWLLIYASASSVSPAPRTFLNRNSVPGDSQSVQQPNLQPPSQGAKQKASDRETKQQINGASFLSKCPFITCVSL